MKEEDDEMAESTALVSVIVPVYNTRRYLAQCVRSIVAQSHSWLEILLVDDGSTDGSGRMCDELAAADRRIRVIHKKNGGLSDARNTGLRQCHGQWVAFVDSDDYVSPVYVEALVRSAADTGCAISAVPFGTPFPDGKSCRLDGRMDEVPSAVAVGAEKMQEMTLYQKVDNATPWHLFRRDVLGADPFPVGLYYEDLASTYRILHRVDRAALLDDRRLYAYRCRPDSIIRQSYRHQKGASALIVASRMGDELPRWYPGLTRAVASRCFSLCRMVFAQIPVSDPDRVAHADRQALWAVLKKNRATVLRDPHARPRERVAAAIAMMGEGAFTRFCVVGRRLGLMR